MLASCLYDKGFLVTGEPLECMDDDNDEECDECDEESDASSDEDERPGK